VNADPFLRRLESTATVACVAMSIVALAISRGRPGPAIAVLGGGLLIAFSYWTIGSGIGALGRAAAYDDVKEPTQSLAWIMTKVFARYALLVLLAYVMIARLRMHPIGLLVGASSMVAAAAIEAVRIHVRKSGS
jgi:hypothetical protein